MGKHCNHRQGNWKEPHLNLQEVDAPLISMRFCPQVFTPLTSNLDDDANDVLPSIHCILISELLVTPFLRYIDLSGNFKRHILAPRALTQQEMNLNFLGTPYRLGERFTVRSGPFIPHAIIGCSSHQVRSSIIDHRSSIPDPRSPILDPQAMTNILFVCFFYSALFPPASLFGFAILQIQYYTDKFCIVRIWRRGPAIGPHLARISRRYFFSAALVVFICSSAFTWAQFPYDNVCDKEGEGSTERLSQKKFDNVRLLDGSVVNVTVSQEQPVYHCR